MNVEPDKFNHAQGMEYYLFIKGTEGITQAGARLLNSPEAGKKWLLLGFNLSIDYTNLDPFQNIFDSQDGDDENPPSKQSFFEFRVNQNAIFKMPLESLPMFEKTELIFKELGKNELEDRVPYTINWNDHVSMILSFWDNKPRPYVKVIARIIRMEDKKGGEGGRT